jgi:hypothetical protein
MNNRELKFRVWLHDTKEWGNVSCIEVFNSTGKLEYLYQDQPYTIQQYTGLKDKNGKEIYEGDICNAGMVTGPIDFIIGGFSLASNPLIEFLPKDACIFSPDYDPSWIDVEVIGNIMQNPELIKNK